MRQTDQLIYLADLLTLLNNIHYIFHLPKIEKDRLVKMNIPIMGFRTCRKSRLTFKVHRFDVTKALLLASPILTGIAKKTELTKVSLRRSTGMTNDLGEKCHSKISYPTLPNHKWKLFLIQSLNSKSWRNKLPDGMISWEYKSDKSSKKMVGTFFPV